MACPTLITQNTSGVPPPAFDSFQQVTVENITKMIMSSPSKSCKLDPLPTWLLKVPEVLKTLAPIITQVVNISLSTGIVPSALKSAYIQPTLKKQGLDLEDKKNYRPVSNLAFLGKLLEKAVAKQLSHHMSENHLHDCLQSAYKPKHGTETALIKIKNDIDLAMNKGQGVLLLLLDLSAAFDTLDHSTLLNRLSSDVGINGTALNWFKSYLSARTQRVIIDSVLSDPVDLTVGVPQGSILGPLLFLIYILPLGKLIDQFNIKRHGYADDTQLYTYFSLNDPQSLSQAMLNIEKCVTAVKEWMTLNKLKLNDSKTEFLLISPKYHYQKLMKLDPCIRVGNTTIKPTKWVRNLGAIFDANMTMVAHTNMVTRSMHYHIRRIAKIRGHLDDATASRVICALVTSRLDYNNSLLAGTSKANLNRLQLAHNCAARLLTRSKKMAHMTPILQDLHWLPVPQRITYKIMVLVYKILHENDTPIYLQELLQKYTPARSLRSKEQYKHLCIPRSRNIYGDKAFARFAPWTWNGLPEALKLKPSCNSFKKTLKSHLFLC